MPAGSRPSGARSPRNLGEVALVVAAGREAMPTPPRDLCGPGARRIVEATEGRDRSAADGRDGARSLALREAARTGARTRVGA